MIAGTTAFISGGWLPESVRGTESHQLFHMTDWFATLLGPGVANGNVAPGPGKTLDSIDQWPKLVSGAAGADPRCSTFESTLGSGLAPFLV